MSGLRRIEGDFATVGDEVEGNRLGPTLDALYVLVCAHLIADLGSF
jgi:hypothetical protein